jgi:hypothetical protein
VTLQEGVLLKEEGLHLASGYRVLHVVAKKKRILGHIELENKSFLVKQGRGKTEI